MVQKWSWSTLLEKCYPCLEGIGNGNGRDTLLWDVGLKQHASGEYSMAVVQANSRLEDQSQVVASSSATYIGVFDGHGGPDASKFVNRHLFPFIHQFAREQGGLSTDVIKKAFNKTEEEFVRLVRQELPTKPHIASVGSCCLTGIVSDDTLYVANLGDSRAVLGRTQLYGNRNSVVAERLTTDHNVGDEEVRKEVVALHPDDEHIVTYCRGVWRIKGIIQVSRSIGDVYLKKPEFIRDPIFQQFGNLIPLKRPVMTAEPSIMSRKLNSRDLFIIFASDGLWEHLSDEVAVQIVFTSPRKGIAKRLVRVCIEVAAKKQAIRYGDIMDMKKGLRRQFHDDITVIVVYLDNHKSRDCIGRFDNAIIDSTTAPTDMHNITGRPEGVST